MGLFAFYAVLILGAICIWVSAYRSRRFFTAILLTSLQGIAALFAVNVLGTLIDIHININAFSLIFSGIFGTAGVILMLLFDSFISRI